MEAIDLIIIKTKKYIVWLFKGTINMLSWIIIIMIYGIVKITSKIRDILRLW